MIITAPATITAKQFAETNNAAKFAAFVATLNNAVYAGREGRTHKVRCSIFAAKFIASYGFDGVRLGDVWSFRRSYACEILPAPEGGDECEIPVTWAVPEREHGCPEPGFDFLASLLENIASA